MTRKICILFLLFSLGVMAQRPVTTQIDTTRNKIGAQFNLTIKAIADTNTVVVFPKGQNFGRLEVIRDYDIDTVKANNRYELIKKYGLTQFDSGRYVIPSLKVVIGKKQFDTDSIKVEVSDVKVDTLKQKLYDIKDVIAEGDTNWSAKWLYWLIGWVALVFIGLGIWKLITRKKKNKQAEEVFKTPIEKANTLLEQLEQKHLLEQGEIKAYYSELTDIARTYIEEAVHIPAMESTTAELIAALRLAACKKNMKLSPETVENLEAVLRQADLVKFAKSKPLDFEIAEDRKKIGTAIVKIDSAIPEETDEEDLEAINEQARLEKLRKQKRQKILNVTAFVVMIVFAFFIGLIVTKGFDYVRNLVKGDPTKELLEGEWVASEYGDPSVIVKTPAVLTRQSHDADKAIFTDEQKFTYGKYTDAFSVMLTTSRIADSAKTDKLLDETVEAIASRFEKDFKAKNISLKSDEYELPAGQKGMKTFGSMKLTNPETKESYFMNYDLLTFTQGTGVVQLLMIYQADDQNAIKMVEKVFDSVEIKTSP
ncbi:Oxygen tolerance [Flavobacterium longum]|uniref:hypothetical protein n=1 Tax=Flavobacterium longum TaxID=1299340 RepID=UPI0039EA6ABF